MRIALPAAFIVVALACVLHVGGSMRAFLQALVAWMIFPICALALGIFVVWSLAAQARRRRRLCEMPPRLKRLHASRHTGPLALALALLLVGGAARAESPRSYPATVLSVHDGDTITALVDLGFDLQFHTSVRLAHLDAPELPTPEGFRSRDALKALVGGKPVVILSPGRDKYGRVLGTIFLGETNVNALLLQRGLAKPYEGGKR